MSALNYTIVLKDKGHHDEGIADAAITPGMAVAMAADGKWDPTTSTVGLTIATEDALQGKTITDAYAQGDRLFMYHPVPGDHVNVLVPTGQDIAVGDKLAVGTGGKFVETAGGNLIALEGPGVLAADTYVACRVLSTIVDNDTVYTP